MAAIANPELYDALREAGATEPRARAAEQSTLPAARVATKAEVKEKVTEEIRPVERTLVKVWTAVSILVGISIANFFFAVGGLLLAYNATLIAENNRAAIFQNSMAIAENRTAIEGNARAIEANARAIEANAQAIEANAQAIAANARAIAENRAAIAANSEKLDEILRLLQVARQE